MKNETRNYVPKIMALAIIGKNLKSFGFEEIDFHEPLDFEEVQVPPMTDLVLLSEHLKVDFAEIQRLNPELLRWFTPIANENYMLRVPVGTKAVFEICCKVEPEKFLAKAFQKYKVIGSRSSLADVAKKFRLKKTDVLEQINQLGKFKRLKRGQFVYLPFREGQSKKDRMYADLYERPRRSVRRRRQYLKIVRRAKNMAAESPVRQCIIRLEKEIRCGRSQERQVKISRRLLFQIFIS